MNGSPVELQIWILCDILLSGLDSSKSNEKVLVSGDRTLIELSHTLSRPCWSVMFFLRWHYETQIKFRTNVDYFLGCKISKAQLEFLYSRHISIWPALSPTNFFSFLLRCTSEASKLLFFNFSFNLRKDCSTLYSLSKWNSFEFWYICTKTKLR